jgi:hypothetical protein
VSRGSDPKGASEEGPRRSGGPSPPVLRACERPHDAKWAAVAWVEPLAKAPAGSDRDSVA